jgi:DNA-binding FadR family transcriptional regulator
MTGLQDEANGVRESTYRPGYSVAAEEILKYIEEQGFRPGDRLPTESEFTSLLGLSRTVTRDALKTLAAVGHITTQRGRGIFVAESPHFSTQLTTSFNATDIDHIMMLFEFRASQEKSASELAAKRATPAELFTIEKAVEEYAARVEEHDIPRLTACDHAFHRAISRASHNNFFIDSIGSSLALQQHVVTVAFGGFSGSPLEKALAEHTAIFEAIRRGDSEAAGAAALAHIERTKADYQAEIGRRLLGPNG